LSVYKNKNKTNLDNFHELLWTGKEKVHEILFGKSHRRKTV